MEYDRNDDTEMETKEPRAEDAALTHAAAQTYADPVERAPQYSMFMRAPSPVLIAVVDESGYLVPLWSASGLLRVCKSYWRASQD